MQGKYRESYMHGVARYMEILCTIWLVFLYKTILNNKVQIKHNLFKIKITTNNVEFTCTTECKTTTEKKTRNEAYT